MTSSEGTNDTDELPGPLREVTVAACSRIEVTFATMNGVRRTQAVSL